MILNRLKQSKFDSKMAIFANNKTGSFLKFFFLYRWRVYAKRERPWATIVEFPLQRVVLAFQVDFLIASYVEAKHYNVYIEFYNLDIHRTPGDLYLEQLWEIQ